MSQPLSNFQMRDAEALLHPFTNAVALRETGALVIERGEGVRVFDQAGRGYIEGLAGLWCCGLGFGNAELVEAARRRWRSCPTTSSSRRKSHEPAVELAEKIKALAPGRMARVFYQTSGSEANDTQVKLAWYYNNARGRPAKKKIVARQKAYHGVTIVAASLTGLPNSHRDFDLPVAGIRHLSTPHHWKGAEPGESEAAYAGAAGGRARGADRGRGAGHRGRLHRRAGDGRGRGHRAAARAISRRSAAVCRRHDVLMISDEVICGFGRTGAVVRGAGAGLRAELDLHGQAADRGLPAAERGGDRRATWPRRSRRTRGGSAPSGTATPTAGIRSPARWG